MTLKEMFDQCDADYRDCDGVVNKRSQRADLHAFIMLDELCPGGGDIITASEHDEFYLSIDCDELETKATPEIIRDLSRCGIRYDKSNHCLCMFT